MESEAQGAKVVQMALGIVLVVQVEACLHEVTTSVPDVVILTENPKHGHSHQSLCKSNRKRNTVSWGSSSMDELGARRSIHRLLQFHS